MEHPTIVVKKGNKVEDYIALIYSQFEKHDEIAIQSTIYCIIEMEELGRIFTRLNCRVGDWEMGHIIGQDQKKVPVMRVNIRKTGNYNFSKKFEKWLPQLK